MKLYIITDYLRQIIADFWATIAEMSPYLLFGFLVAGILSVLISQKTVERHLGGRGIWPFIKASIFGVPLPLCSCGVIPVAMSLRKHGASKGSSISFLLSTPQTGLDSIFVTFSLLGPVFAIFRPIAAFITGVIGGILVNIFGETSQEKASPPPECSDECCGSEAEKHKIPKALKFGFVTLPRDIGRSMLLGLIIAAVITAVVPEGFLAAKLGTGILAMVVMMLLGIPVYVCATASVPIAAAMILKGITPGAALVFLMTGPATNAASFVTIWKVLGKATAVTYLATVAGCALLGGIVLDRIATGTSFEIVTRPPWMLPPIVKYICAMILLLILVGAIIAGKNEPAENPETQTTK